MRERGEGISNYMENAKMSRIFSKIPGAELVFRQRQIQRV